MFRSPVTAASSTDDRKADVARQLSDAEFVYRQTFTLYFQRQMQLFWNNPTGLTPQDVSDALGTKAAASFTAFAFLRQALVAAWQAAGETDDRINKLLPYPTVPFTINGDGTVSIKS